VGVNLPRPYHFHIMAILSSTFHSILSFASISEKILFWCSWFRGVVGSYTRQPHWWSLVQDRAKSLFFFLSESLFSFISHNAISFKLYSDTVLGIHLRRCFILEYMIQVCLLLVSGHPTHLKQCPVLAKTRTNPENNGMILYLG